MKETPGHRRSIAVVCDWVPYPVRSGDNKRTAEMIAVLRENGWRVELVLTRAPLPRETTALCLEKVDALHLFKGGSPLRYLQRLVVPRIDALLDRLRLPTTGEAVGRLMGRKRHLAAELFGPLPRYERGFKEWIAARARRRGWDAVVVNFVWLHPAIDRLPAGTLTLLDTIDLQHERSAQFGERGLPHAHALSRREEAEALGKFDAVLAIQRREAAEIRAMCPGRTVITVGASTVPARPPSAEPDADRVLYVGGDNAANVDGLRSFLEACWPRVRSARPGAGLRVCGYVYQAFLAERFDGVEFLGHVDDVEREYARASVVVNPISIGTGLKIKTIEALAHGKPLVTTDKGIEGMFGDPSGACVVTDSHPAFAAAVAELLRSAEERDRLRREARRYAEAFLSPAVVYRDFLEFLDRRLPASGERALAPAGPIDRRRTHA